jgi:Outer membrane protein beta-barrel domain
MRERGHRIANLCAGAVLVAAASAAPAAAQESYIGGTYSWTNLDASGNTGSNPTGAGYKLFFGHDAKYLLGWEAGYTNFGSFNGTVDATDGSGTYKLTGSGWDVALTVHVPLGKVVGIYGKLGYLFWSTDLTSALEDLVTGSDSGRNLFYSAGLRLNVSRVVGLLVEWERDKLGDHASVDMVNAGLRLNF